MPAKKPNLQPGEAGMPNGGPDNCSTCGFNRCNGGVWKSTAIPAHGMPFCVIRQVPVLNDHWTYCRNWHTRTRKPVGPVYASGLYEGGYHRIPWDGAVEPETIGNGRCSECSAEFAEGIGIAAVEGAMQVFCSNRCYLHWWRRKHPGEEAVMSGELGKE
jgi:hypothetical protein